MLEVRPREKAMLSAFSTNIWERKMSRFCPPPCSKYVDKTRNQRDVIAGRTVLPAHPEKVLHFATQQA